MLNTPDLRKLVMGILAAGRQALYDGELAEEEPMDTLFDPNAPHCSALKSRLDRIADGAATKTDQSVTRARALAGKKLRFMYKPASRTRRSSPRTSSPQLALAGIDVHPIPVDKDGYNALNCGYIRRRSTRTTTAEPTASPHADDYVNCHDSGDARGEGLRL